MTLSVYRPCAQVRPDMALLATLLTPGLHISELAVRRPLLRSRSHAVCKLDVATANAFSCMGFNIGRQVPGQLACRTAARPCATPHPDSRPHQLGELNVLEEEEIDALLAGAHAALWTAIAPRPRPSLGPPALRRPANAIPSSGRPASSSLGQSTGTCWLARVSLSLMGPESRR